MDVMTPKERCLAVMRREKPDRLPMDYWGMPEATLKLMRPSWVHKRMECL